MRFHKILFAIVTASSAMALPALGCYGTGSAYVAYDEPPAPREEVIVTRPGFIFVHGHWLREGGRWRWHGGYYERERHGYAYREGRWEHHGNRHVWVEGGWRTL
jgi:hypothetical protein